MTKAQYLATLDAFARGYIACALWSSTDESRDDGGDPLDSNYDFHDIERASLESMVADCRAFQKQAAEPLAAAYARDYSESRAGHDFWLTRNGHGAGFWDRSELEPEGDEWDALQRPLDTWTAEDRATRERLKLESPGHLLSEAARTFGSRDLSVYRGKVYAN